MTTDHNHQQSAATASQSLHEGLKIATLAFIAGDVAWDCVPHWGDIHGAIHKMICGGDTASMPLPAQEALEAIAIGSFLLALRAGEIKASAFPVPDGTDEATIRAMAERMLAAEGSATLQ